MNDGAYLYILRCADGSYYVGTTRSTLEVRIAQHNAGTFGGYTQARRPVELVFSQWFDRITDAIENERKIKKWSREKKEAFIRGDMASLQELSRRRTLHSFETPADGGLLRGRECIAGARRNSYLMGLMPLAARFFD
jgi:putative endonuclease